MRANINGAENAFPLSLNQMNIWALEQSASGTSINNISATIRVSGRTDCALMQKCIRAVLASDPSLRTRITIRDGNPAQYHAAFSGDMAPILDFTTADADSFSHWAASFTQIPIFALDEPLYRFVICRTGEGELSVLAETHHIVSDGWSQIMLCNKIGETYLALLRGDDSEPAPAPDYADFVISEQKYLASDTYKRDETYWKAVLGSLAEPAAAKTLKSADISQVGRRKSYRLSQQLNHAIFSFCQKNRVAPFAVFYMALATYLKRSGMGDRFTIGVPVFNRSTFAFKQTTGMFVSTLPFCCEVSEDWSFRQFNARLEESWLDMLRHQRFPFSHIEKLSGSAEPLFRIMLSYQDSQILKNEEASVHISGLWHYSGFQVEQLCIHLTNLEDNKVYSVDYDYLTQLFSESEIDEIHQYLCHILSAALKDPEKPLRSLPLLDEGERERVLYSFNDTYAYRRSCGAYAVFAETAEKTPRRAAVICDGVRTTYEELKLDAGRVAGALARERELVAVYLPRDKRLFAALVGIMQANCAWLILPPDQPVNRLREILTQSGATLILSTPSLSDTLGAVPVPVIDIDAPEGAPARAKTALPEDLAYVVYTSGSTGKPKGVEIMQKSLVNLAAVMRPIYGVGAVLSVCSVGFDAFILESAAALLCGRTIVLADPCQQENPEALAKLILDYGVGFIATTPSRLAAMMKNAAFAEAMRRLESIVCGGEPFTGEILQRIKERTGARIYNQYGPSEAAVAVSHRRLDSAARISIGKPLQNCHIYILDNELQPMPVHVYGEIYIGGVCVGRGYRNEPELTKLSFIPSPFEVNETLYKTGDLACWTDEGELLLAGRRDRQVKLRGVRMELQEVSGCLMRHPDVSDAAARIIEHNGEAVLVGYFVSEKSLSEVELMSFAASYLPRSMIPTRVLRVERIPLTPNGKLDEKLLPEPELTDGQALPSNERQRLLLDIFKRVLHTPELYADSNYFLFGGNSLNAMETISLIEERFGVRLMVSDLYACRTAAALDKFLSLGTATRTAETIGKAPELKSYPLTETQKSIYIQSAMDESGVAYNMPCAFALESEPDIRALKAAFRALIADDAIFRTKFMQTEGAIAAIVQDDVEFDVPLLEAGSVKEAIEGFLRPFDLAGAPLLRAALYRDGDGSWLLFVDIHHITSDGMSTPLLLERLSRFYTGQAAPAHLTYHDYAWHCAAAQGAGSADYWAKKLRDAPKLLALPTDFSRPSVFDFHGASTSCVLSKETTERVEAFCREREMTPYMFFAGALGLLLSRLSGQNDIVIGTPVSGRKSPELRAVCGPLMTTLPLRMRVQGNIGGYFSDVKTAALEMIDHADYSLEDMLSSLGIPRDASHNPLYQVLFQIRPLDTEKFSLGGIRLRYIPVPTGTSKLDMSIEAAKQDGCYQFYIEYATSLFSKDTAALFGRSLACLAERLASASDDLPAEHVDALSNADRIRYISRPNHTVYPYVDLPVHRVIEEETMLRPNDTAVIWHGEETSFAQLELRAAKTAGLLKKHGIVPGDRVGLCCRREPGLLAALLGILKAGAVYVPFISDYPATRVAYMMETAGAKLILSDAQTALLLGKQDLRRPVLSMDEPSEPMEASYCPQGSEPMYILFTSGSTGKPKGVQLPHRALSNLLGSLEQWMSGVSGPALCITNVTFDIFITETLLALAQGRAVVLADEEEMLLPWKLAELIAAHKPRVAQFTPSRLQMCLRNSAFAGAIGCLEFTILVGEMVQPSLVTAFKKSCSGRLINMYGPTEAAVYVTAGELFAGESVTIGTPLNNCRVYILDKDRRPALVSSRGEMYLAGVCLADGYVSRPELTGEAFVDDPFFPGQRMYRSGDIGRLRSDGSLECLGRTDAQVKINGNRVELGEISEALTASGAEQAVAIPQKQPDGSTTLYALVTPQSLSGDALKRSLRGLLPEYMLPSRIFALEKMPYNASGKIDMSALKSLIAGKPPEDIPEAPALRLEPQAAERPAPQREPAKGAEPVPPPAAERQRRITAGELLAMWEKVLGRTEMSAELSFFEQGGTSLSALSILNEYFNHNISMTLSAFYKAPTAAAQAELLAKNCPEFAEKAEEPAFSDRAPGRVPEIGHREGGSLSAVLLTGATGFLGAHLLRSFLEKGCEKVICLVRGGDEKRLFDTLSWYFGSGWAVGARRHVEVLPGDVCTEGFGLPEDKYAALTRQVRVVCHAAADVRHYAADDSILNTNISGTKRVLKFIADSGAALLHISTASVSGDFVASDPGRLHQFTENDLDIGQNWKDNLYIRSKLLAEREVYKAGLAGADVRVFRIGRLIGRFSDGVFQKNPETNAFYRIVQGVANIRALPLSMAAMPIELTPVDVCAGAIAELYDAKGTVFHIVQPVPAPLGQTLKPLFPELRILPDEEFAELLSSKSAQGSPALSSLIDIWNSVRGHTGNVLAACERTQRCLREKGFSWPDCDLGMALESFRFGS